MSTGPQPVSLIVPFAGSHAAARLLVDRLAVVRRRPGDEVIVVDNTATPAFGDGVPEWLTVLRADDHASSYYARNVGAEAARGEWLLFTDADCEPNPDLIERHLETDIPRSCGAVGGAILDAPGQPDAVARYTRARGLFNQGHYTSLEGWAFAMTANVLIRREAFDAVGGFCEGVRSLGDQEFFWRLKRAGWTLGYNERAAIFHHHRETVRGLARQMARYGAGGAWFCRRHGEPDFHAQEPDARSVAKGARNLARSLLALDADGFRFRVFDAVGLVARQIASRLPNVAVEAAPSPATVVLCAERFPADDAQLAAARRADRNGGCHVEARGRPLLRLRPAETRALDVHYAEDDADVRRWRAGLEILVRHPVRARRWLAGRGGRRALSALLALAPAARRVESTGTTRLQPLDAGGRQLAAELAPLLGIEVGVPSRSA
jgi:GT2 family glycosyltransferase